MMSLRAFGHPGMSASAGPPVGHTQGRDHDARHSKGLLQKALETVCASTTDSVLPRRQTVRRSVSDGKAPQSMLLLPMNQMMVLTLILIFQELTYRAVVNRHDQRDQCDKMVVLTLLSLVMMISVPAESHRMIPSQQMHTTMKVAALLCWSCPTQPTRSPKAGDHCCGE